MERQYLSKTKKAIAPKEQREAIAASNREKAIARYSPHPIEELQGAIGNQAVNRLLANQPPLSAKPMFRGLSHELVIQAKLTIGAVGDKYEQEADRVAKQVVSQINTPAPQSSTESPSVQRQETPKEDDELMLKPETDTIQRQGMSDEDELRGKPMVQRQSSEADGSIPSELEASINQAKGSGHPLPNTIRQPMEQALGANFSGVKVHTDAQSDQLNQSLQAKAFTTGKDIFFKPEEYNPRTQQGQELIAHELTHFCQQNVGQLQQHTTPSSTGNSIIQMSPKPARIINSRGAGLHKSNRKKVERGEATEISVRRGGIFGTGTKYKIPFNAPIQVDWEKTTEDGIYVWAEYNGHEGYIKKLNVETDEASNSGYETERDSRSEDSETDEASNFGYDEIPDYVMSNIKTKEASNFGYDEIPDYVRPEIKTKEALNQRYKTSTEESDEEKGAPPELLERSPNTSQGWGGTNTASQFRSSGKKLLELEDAASSQKEKKSEAVVGEKDENKPDPSSILDFNNLKSIKMPTQGNKGAVFILTDEKKNKLVVKFQDDSPHGAVIGTKILEEVGAMTPKLWTFEIQELTDIKLDARADSESKKNLSKYQSAQSEFKYAIIQELAQGISIGDMLTSDPSGLLQALQDPQFQDDLGRIIAADQFVGNSDRLQGEKRSGKLAGFFNPGNLFIYQIKNSFRAIGIDNDFSPTLTPSSPGYPMGFVVPIRGGMRLGSVAVANKQEFRHEVGLIIDAILVQVQSQHQQDQEVAEEIKNVTSQKDSIIDGVVESAQRVIEILLEKRNQPKGEGWKRKIIKAGGGTEKQQTERHEQWKARKKKMQELRQ